MWYGIYKLQHIFKPLKHTLIMSSLNYFWGSRRNLFLKFLISQASRTSGWFICNQTKVQRFDVRYMYISTGTDICICTDIWARPEILHSVLTFIFISTCSGLSFSQCSLNYSQWTRKGGQKMALAAPAPAPPPPAHIWHTEYGMDSMDERDVGLGLFLLCFGAPARNAPQIK